MYAAPINYYLTRSQLDHFNPKIARSTSRLKFPLREFPAARIGFSFAMGPNRYSAKSGIRQSEVLSIGGASSLAHCENSSTDGIQKTRIEAGRSRCQSTARRSKSAVRSSQASACGCPVRSSESCHAAFCEILRYSGMIMSSSLAPDRSNLATHLGCLPRPDHV